MSRHLADHRTAPGTSRVRRFLTIARSEAAHPAVRALFLRKVTRTGASRLAAFLRVERGHSA